MKKFILTLFVTLLLASPALAEPTASHRQAAEELLQSMQLDQLLNKSIDSMIKMQVQQQPQLAPFQNILREFLNRYMSAENMRDSFIKLYSENYSEQELREISAFYRTPTGQKVVQKMPKLMAQGAALGQQQVKEHLPELREMIDQEVQRLKKAQQGE